MAEIDAAVELGRFPDRQSALRAAIDALVDPDLADQIVLRVKPPSLAQLRERRDELIAVAARHGASNLRVFGSVARGEADERSDLDLLVDLEPGRSLFDLAHLQQDLQRVLRCRVDVGTASSIKERKRDRILAEARPL